MTVLIDTNVVLDVLLKREPFYVHSTEILRLSEKGLLKGYLTSNSITDIAYILRKSIGKFQTKKVIGDLIKVADIVSVTRRDIEKSLTISIDDFEDALQAVCAKKVKADYIVTRNENDFEGSNILAISPERFIGTVGLNK